MSDCSTHAFEYPGVTRIKVFFTDKTEREIDYPFVTLDREIKCVTVDGIEYVEVVRCRDCKHMHRVRSWLGMDVDECWLHADPETGALGKNRTEPDGFCAWGVRKDD